MSTASNPWKAFPLIKSMDLGTLNEMWTQTGEKLTTFPSDILLDTRLTEATREFMDACGGDNPKGSGQIMVRSSLLVSQKSSLQDQTLSISLYRKEAITIWIY